MVLEATVVCVDNSEWMRNGDFIPTRIQAQQDAATVVCRMKTRLNPENTIGLLSLADNQVRVTLTNDVNKVLKCLQLLEPKGQMNFITGIRIAHLTLKHRQNKNQKMRIVAFIGSPVDTDDKEELNSEKLTTFIDTLNGKDKTSHLVTAQPGPMLSDVILSSPILMGESGAPLAQGGQGFESFGIDPTEDPELAMALRVSLEEQRQRQEIETRRVQQESFNAIPEEEDGGVSGLAQAGAADLPYNPEMGGGGFSQGMIPDISALSEEEQLALALQMSMQGSESTMEVDSTGAQPSQETLGEGSSEDKPEDDDDDAAEMEELMQNKDVLQSILSSLPGVNPEEALQNLEEMTQATPDQKEEEEGGGKEEKEGNQDQDKNQEEGT